MFSLSSPLSYEWASPVVLRSSLPRLGSASRIGVWQRGSLRIDDAAEAVDDVEEDGQTVGASAAVVGLKSLLLLRHLEESSDGEPGVGSSRLARSNDGRACSSSAGLRATGRAGTGTAIVPVTGVDKCGRGGGFRGSACSHIVVIEEFVSRLAEQQLQEDALSKSAGASRPA